MRKQLSAIWKKVSHKGWVDRGHASQPPWRQAILVSLVSTERGTGEEANGIPAFICTKNRNRCHTRMPHPPTTIVPPKAGATRFGPIIPTNGTRHYRA
jgi:hypothetical protein